MPKESLAFSIDSITAMLISYLSSQLLPSKFLFATNLNVLIIGEKQILEEVKPLLFSTL